MIIIRILLFPIWVALYVISLIGKVVFLSPPVIFILGIANFFLVLGTLALWAIFFDLFTFASDYPWGINWYMLPVAIGMSFAPVIFSPATLIQIFAALDSFIARLRQF